MYRSFYIEDWAIVIDDHKWKIWHRAHEAGCRPAASRTDCYPGEKQFRCFRCGETVPDGIVLLAIKKSSDDTI
jgi:hypothetical protein